MAAPRRRRLGFLRFAAALACCFGAVAVASAAERKVELRVERTEAAGSFDAAEVEHALAVAVTRLPCDVRLVRPGETPDLVLRVRLDLWRESQAPGVSSDASAAGEASLSFVVECRYHVEVLRPGADKPDAERDGKARGAATSKRLAAFDPYRAAREAAAAKIAKDVRKLLCR